MSADTPNSADAIAMEIGEKILEDAALQLSRLSQLAGTARGRALLDEMAGQVRDLQADYLRPRREAAEAAAAAG